MYQKTPIRFTARGNISDVTLLSILPQKAGRRGAAPAWVLMIYLWWVWLQFSVILFVVLAVSTVTVTRTCCGQNSLY